MQPELPFSSDRREQMAMEVLQLTQGCPFDNCNPDYCPLHEVRNLCPESRREWVGVLSDDDLHYLLVHHEICLHARSDHDLARISRLNLDEIAERIRFDIAERGHHVLSKEDLESILGPHGAKSEMENQMHVDNFCLQYGFVPLHEEGFTTLGLGKPEL